MMPPNMLTLKTVSVFFILLPTLVWAGSVRLSVDSANPILATDELQTTYLKVSLEGIPIDNEVERDPLNVSIVIDRSGSMGGDKIQRAREAAIIALDYFSGDDILSIIAYDHEVEVLVSAAKVRNRMQIIKRINQLQPRGNTGLYAGVEQGSQELLEFLDQKHINRLILLSDGKANKGPSSPDELGALGKELAKMGISVTTVGMGLGYNEDLMFELADKSDGNHAFVENSADLAKVFRDELGELGTVVAQNVVVIITCPVGVVPKRMLGRDASIDQSIVQATFNQLYVKQEKYILLEVEIDPTKTSANPQFGVSIEYQDKGSNSRQKLMDSAVITFSPDQAAVVVAENKEVMIAVTEQLAFEASRTAMKLRDSGQRVEALKLLKKTSYELDLKAKLYGSSRLKAQRQKNDRTTQAIERKEDWRKTRKQMRTDQFSIKKQQSNSR